MNWIINPPLTQRWLLVRQWLCIPPICCRWPVRRLLQLSTESASLTKQWLLNLFESHLPSAPDATWQLYASFWQMAAHHEAYAALAEQMTAAWQALVEEIIHDGVTDGTLRCADIPRTARQISAMLNGYADLLTINPSEKKASEGMADLTQFIDHLLS
ncbi:TetR family transcriptional regulator C-terminal domain-containing protein [Pantoea agglomerans]|uniref:TetR family transcriptional regulator C-terminal domain-containing protein n=1 Tax=Enterobacter agglomerans TaxID=549 RepID=UPI0030FE323A